MSSAGSGDSRCSTSHRKPDEHALISLLSSGQVRERERGTQGWLCSTSMWNFVQLCMFFDTGVRLHLNNNDVCLIFADCSSRLTLPGDPRPRQWRNRVQVSTLAHTFFSAPPPAAATANSGFDHFGPFLLWCSFIWVSLPVALGKECFLGGSDNCVCGSSGCNDLNRNDELLLFKRFTLCTTKTLDLWWLEECSYCSSHWPS